MPKSRNRRKSRPRRPHARREVITLRPGQDITPFLTPDDIAHLAGAIDAAARGDVRGTIEHELAGLVVEESLTVPRLQDLLVSDAVPAWVYSRWCVDQALRWMLFHEDPRTDEAARITLASTHRDRLDTLLDDPTGLIEYGNLVVAADWVCHQLATYEYGGLADFLDLRAESGLLDKSDRVHDWWAAPMSVYAFLEMAGSALVLHDLVTDDEVRALNVGAMSDRAGRDLLLGRVVPISTEPGLMFESRPIALDAETAQDAASRIRAGRRLGWLAALAAARDQGRLPIGFSCTEHTLFTSDLVARWPDELGEEPAPRMQDLMSRGHSYAVANAVGVLECALIAARISPDSVGAVVPHVAAAMGVPGAFEAALLECAGPDTAAEWRVLAGVTPEHVSGRCHALADRAGAA